MDQTEHTMNRDDAPPSSGRVVVALAARARAALGAAQTGSDGPEVALRRVVAAMEPLLAALSARTPTGSAHRRADATSDPERDEWLEMAGAFMADELTAPDGSLVRNKVRNELADFFMLMRQTSLVYSALTRNRVSKLNTVASAVIAVAEDLATEARDQAFAEGHAAALAEHGLEPNTVSGSRS